VKGAKNGGNLAKVEKGEEKGEPEREGGSNPNKKEGDVLKCERMSRGIYGVQS